MSGQATPTKVPSFWPRLVQALPVALLCGAIGPVFVFHFLTEDDVPRWILWFGVLITLIAVAAAVGIAWWRYQGALRHLRLLAHADRAQAAVVSLETTHAQVNDDPVLRIRLRIHGDDLSPREVTVLKVVPDGMHRLLRRGTVAVLFDPETQEWEIDWATTRRWYDEA